MTELFAVGLNHKSAAVELREMLAVPEVEQADVLREVVQRAGLREGMLLNTCNRVEIYGVADDWSSTGRTVIDGLLQVRGVPKDVMEGHCFVRGTAAAVRHIFRVTASLESMVMGEPQIVRQMKDAFAAARGHGTVGPVLGRCITTALKVAKRVRTETEVGRGAASVPSVAVDLAQSIFGDLHGCVALLVGAGAMSEQAGWHLRDAGVAEIVVVNRSSDRGIALASNVDGRYVSFEHIEEQLARADVVVTSTGATGTIIGAELMRRVMKARRNRPIFFVDIAVPRDVDVGVAAVDHVFLYNIDDLQGIVQQNLRSRELEAERAAALVDLEVDEFLRWQRGRSVGPLIGRLQAHARSIVDKELERALHRLPNLGAHEREVIEQMGWNIMQKLLHRPIVQLRGSSQTDVDVPDAANLSEAMQKLFALEPHESAASEEEGGVGELGEAEPGKPRAEPVT